MWSSTVRRKASPTAAASWPMERWAGPWWSYAMSRYLPDALDLVQHRLELADEDHVPVDPDRVVRRQRAGRELVGEGLGVRVDGDRAEVDRFLPPHFVRGDDELLDHYVYAPFACGRVHRGKDRERTAPRSGPRSVFVLRYDRTARPVGSRISRQMSIRPDTREEAGADVFRLRNPSPALPLCVTRRADSALCQCATGRRAAISW